jgi:hypothetical protein
MRKERMLAKKATYAARSHGHEIGSFQFERAQDKITGRSQCIHCGMEVNIDTSPMQIEKEITGEAVELSCI